MADYRNFHSSILKFCKDFGSANSLSLIDYEAHANIHELPESDLVGPGDFEVINDEGLFYITTLIGVSTFNDTNLGKLRRTIDLLFEALKPDTVIPWYYADNASLGGTMKVRGPITVMPVMRQAQNRPLQFVGFGLAPNVDGR